MALKGRGRLGQVEVEPGEGDARDGVHVEQIDRDHAPPPRLGVDPRGGDLGPAARRGAEIDDALAVLQQPVFVVDFDELKGRA